jgi:hypothetical protein
MIHCFQISSFEQRIFSEAFTVHKFNWIIKLEL